MSLDLRNRIIQNICKTGVNVGIPRLIQGLKSDNPKYKLVAEKALVEFSGEDFGKDPEAWKRWWMENKSTWLPENEEKTEPATAAPQPQPAQAAPPAHQEHAAPHAPEANNQAQETTPETPPPVPEAAKQPETAPAPPPPPPEIQETPPPAPAPPPPPAPEGTQKAESAPPPPPPPPATEEAQPPAPTPPPPQAEEDLQPIDLDAGSETSEENQEEEFDLDAGFEDLGPDETQFIPRGTVSEEEADDQDVSAQDALNFAFGPDEEEPAPAPAEAEEPQEDIEAGVDQVSELLSEWDKMAETEPEWSEEPSAPEAAPTGGESEDEEDHETKEYETEQAWDYETVEVPTADVPEPPSPEPTPEPEPPSPEQSLEEEETFEIEAPSAAPPPPPPTGQEEESPKVSPPALSSEEEQKVKEAVDWLEILGPKDALPQLLDHVDHPNHFKQKRVLAILHRLTGWSFGPNRKAWEQWYNKYMNYSFKEIRAKAKKAPQE